MILNKVLYEQMITNWIQLCGSHAKRLSRPTSNSTNATK